VEQSEHTQLHIQDVWLTEHLLIQDSQVYQLLQFVKI
jgi:hypothetical protein